MQALEDFDVTVTFCFTPEHRGIAPHHTSAPLVKEEFAEFCASMVRRYAAGVVPERSLAAASG
jgi:beta-xylosidase